MCSGRLSSAFFRYAVYGLVLESDLRLTSIEEIADDGRMPALRLVQGMAELFDAVSCGLPVDPDDHVQHVVLADRRLYMKVENVFEAIVSEDGRVVTCRHLGDIDQRSYEANLLNFVLSASLTLQGEEPIHSTVVEFGGRAVGLLGQSGAGKSTLAASLLERGGELITDDMLRLTLTDGVPIAEQGPYRLKLFDETARRFLPRALSDGHFNTLSGKIMVRPGVLADAERRQGVPLAALFWLSERPPEGEGVAAKRLAGMELVKVLLASTMNRRYQAVDRLARQLAFDERVARIVPVYELQYPRVFNIMNRVVDEIHRLVKA